MTIEEFTEGFELLDEWEDRYAYLMDVGRRMPSMEEEDKIEAHRVRGCQATVWLKAHVEGQQPPSIHFVADSNSQIVRGLVALLWIMYSGKTAESILAMDAPALFARLGLDRHLSPTRSTGLKAMVDQIRGIAAAACHAGT